MLHSKKRQLDTIKRLKVEMKLTEKFFSLAERNNKNQIDQIKIRDYKNRLENLKERLSFYVSEKNEILETFKKVMSVQVIYVLVWSAKCLLRCQIWLLVEATNLNYMSKNDFFH